MSNQSLMFFLEEITKLVDDGSPVDVVYLDFQKAFDKVPHQRLLLKLKAHGIGNYVINWIEKWLTHRRQRVIVDGEISNWKSVLSGVPQGSVLGPILFLIYTNYLEDVISSKVLKFADDTKVFRKVTNDTDKQSLQDDLDKLVKWSEKWQMLLNMDEEYKMGDAVLDRTTQEKDLGVTFSADMKVSEQCGIAASKGNKIIGLITRIIMYNEKQLIVPLYKAIVRPHLEYCIQASRLLKCSFTTLETRRLRGDQIEGFNIVNGYEDVDRNMFFKLKEGSTTRGHKAALVKEQCRFDMRKYSFSQRVINEWNKLPKNCVNASSVNMFKNRIDRYLIRARYT